MEKPFSGYKSLIFWLRNSKKDKLHFSAEEQTRLETYINSKPKVIVKTIPDDQFLVINKPEQ